MKIRAWKIVGASLLAMIVVFLITALPVAAQAPWVGYLVPQNSTGSCGGDTPVELWVDYNDTGLTYGAIGWQVDVHFDPGCVNVTAADFSTSPFHGYKMFVPYASGVVRLSEDNYGSGAIASGTYKLATLTFHGESVEGCTCDVWFDENIVPDTDGKPIVNTYTDGTYTCTAQPQIFDTGAPIKPYPSIPGTHNGTITPYENISVNYIYTYPCTGTGGHTEFAMIWNETERECAVANWDGYVGDWHNISLNTTLTLKEGVVYSYTIRTGSYPQIHHTDELEVDSGIIRCDEFIDTNGKKYTDWILAIKLF